MCHDCYVQKQHSPEQRQKLSAVKKGKPSYVRTEETLEKLRKSLTGKKKNYPSASTRPEVSQKIKDWWTPERRELRRLDVTARNELNPELRVQYGSSGAKNPRWLGGRSGIPYTGNGWWSENLRKYIHERDYETCQICGSQQNLDIHHKDFGKSDHQPENLTLLCHKCHVRVHVEHARNSSCHPRL